MHVLITGGTGFIGQGLVTELLKNQNSVTLVTRHPQAHKSEKAANQDFLAWDADWTDAMERADAVVNLAGENIFGQRWTDKVKKKLYNSRIDTTRKLVNAIEAADDRPGVMVSASGINYYGHGGDRYLREEDEPGSDFLARLCVDWEKEARKVEQYNVRLAIPRISIVLEKQGGALAQMLLPFKLFAGASIGEGSQFFPWIHRLDLCRIILFMLNEPLEGPFNAAAPNPVRMNEFVQQLADQLNRPAWFRIPTWAMELALGEAATPILASLRPSVEKLQKAGFNFHYEYLDEAFGAILQD